MTAVSTTTRYLADVRSAVADLPYGVAAEIVAGIEEELVGLDDAGATRRIAQLGDPALIAASARLELGDGPAVDIRRSQDAAWYTIATGFLLLVGGIAIPIIGWLIGVVLLWASRTWTLADKLIGTLAPPLGGYWIVAAITGGGILFPGAADGTNPLFPAPLALVVLSWIGIVLPFVTLVYLLVRARRVKARG